MGILAKLLLGKVVKSRKKSSVKPRSRPSPRVATIKKVLSLGRGDVVRVQDEYGTIVGKVLSVRRNGMVVVQDVESGNSWDFPVAKVHKVRR